MSRETQEQIEVERDVDYGTFAGEPLLLDVHRTLALTDTRPGVVLIHGGGMWTGSRKDMELPARQLAKAGYVTFSIDYRLVDASTGRHRGPAQLEDVQCAVR